MCKGVYVSFAYFEKAYTPDSLDKSFCESWVLMDSCTCHQVILSCPYQQCLVQVFSTVALGPPWGHGAVLRGARAEALTKELCRDIAKPKIKLDILIGEQGATCVESLWMGATNLERLRTTRLVKPVRSSWRLDSDEDVCILPLLLFIVHMDCIHRQSHLSRRLCHKKTKYFFTQDPFQCTLRINGNTPRQVETFKVPWDDIHKWCKVEQSGWYMDR